MYDILTNAKPTVKHFEHLQHAKEFNKHKKLLKGSPTQKVLAKQKDLALKERELQLIPPVQLL